MPTLVRFFIVLVVLAVAVGVAMVYLGNFVAPNTREMTVRIPSSRLEPKPVAPPPAAETPEAVGTVEAPASPDAPAADDVTTVETPE